MTISKIIDTLPEYRNAGLVTERQQGPYSIWNYTQKVQWERLWDDTTRAARGLITDRTTGEVVARSWDKFFNLGEPGAPAPPAADPVVYEKMDGSLGLLYRDLDGAQRWATRGSFDSPQACAANAMWAEVPVPDEWTVLAEIISPESLIVVRYGFEGLVVLGARNRFTGLDVPRAEVEAWAQDTGQRLVARGPTLGEALSQQSTLPATAEGWVAHWPEHGIRLKIKGDQYRRVHRFLAGGLTFKKLAELWTQAQEERVGWRTLVPAGVPHDDMVHISWACMVFDEHLLHVRDQVTTWAEVCLQFETRKEQALYLKQKSPEFLGAVMLLLHGTGPTEETYRKLALQVARKSFDLWGLE